MRPLAAITSVAVLISLCLPLPAHSVAARQHLAKADPVEGQTYRRGFSVAATAPTTWYVSTGGNDSNSCLTPQSACATINGAIGKANYGDIISIGAGTYHEHVVVNINLSLKGAGITQTKIDGYGTGTALTVQGSGTAVTVANLTVQDGATSSGGAGINNTAALTMTNVLVTNNTFTIPNCSNFAAAGIGVYNSGTLYGSGVTISNNSATNTICLGYNGSYAYNGVGLYNSGTATLVGSTISGNAVTDVNPNNEHAIRGLGIYNSGSLTMNLCNVLDNTSGGSTASNGDAGGGIYSSSYDHSVALTIEHSVIDGNKGVATGGGLYSNTYLGQVNIANSSLIGNQAAQGAGIYSAENTTMNLVASTISQNTARGQGGGMYLLGITSIQNSTISNNQATSGAGIYSNIFSSGSVNVASSTISMNSATSDGGGAYGSDFFTAKNTLIAANTANGKTSDCEGGFISHGFNLIGSGTGCTGFSNGINGDQVGTLAQPINPLLGPLQDNGGPTYTMALLPGSPALAGANPYGCTDNSVPPVLLTTDQRGFPRPDPSVGRCDIGAYQHQGALPNSPTPTMTATASRTATATQTATRTPTNTATATVPASATPTATATSTPLTYNIQQGWNLFAFTGAATGNTTAAQLLGALLQQSQGKLAALYGLNHNAWTPSLIDVNGAFIPANGDFPLQPDTGYLLYSDRQVTFTPLAAARYTPPGRLLVLQPRFTLVGCRLAERRGERCGAALVTPTSGRTPACA